MSERSVQRYMEQFHATGTVAPTIQKRGPDKILSEFKQFTILQTLIHKPISYLHEVQDQLFEVIGVWVHSSTICNQGARIHTQEGMWDSYPTERATPDSVYG